MTHKLIIDCDPGLDDAVALILAHAQADVLGVTTVTGNAPLAATTRNALAVLELLNADTPVHAGAAAPLHGAARHATHIHGNSGLGGTHLPEPHTRVASDDAVGFMLDTVRAHPDTWLVPIGPLTNIALALQRDPSLAQRVAGISLMGGSTTMGNVTAAAEFNIWADPEAAALVFASGAPLTMCGLNLTHQLRTSDAVVRRLPATPLGDFVGSLFNFLHERMQTLIGSRSSALHDPCAVLAITQPQLFTFADRHVLVETAGQHTRGMTLVDERPSASPPAANVQVAYRINAEAAMEHIVAAVSTFTRPPHAHTEHTAHRPGDPR